MDVNWQAVLEGLGCIRNGAVVMPKGQSIMIHVADKSINVGSGVGVSVSLIPDSDVFIVQEQGKDTYYPWPGVTSISVIEQERSATGKLGIRG